MTAKQYLQQSFILNAKIESYQMELEQLRALSTSVSATDLSKERVQTSGTKDRIGEIIANIVGYENTIQERIDQLVNLKREINERIQAMPDDDSTAILQKRYVNFLKWDQIAFDLNKDIRWVFRLHGKGLKNFAIKFNFDH